jgi:hypothetical protein
VAAGLSGASLVLGVSLVALIPMLLYAMAGGRSGVSWVEIVLLGGLATLIAGLALAGMIIGGMARREIRDSQGRLRGAGLALFAMLALPVEAVGSVLVVLFFFGLMTIRVAPHIEPMPAPVMESHQAVPPRALEEANPTPAPSLPGPVVHPPTPGSNAPPQQP